MPINSHFNDNDDGSSSSHGECGSQKRTNLQRKHSVKCRVGGFCELITFGDEFGGARRRVVEKKALKNKK